MKRLVLASLAALSLSSLAATSVSAFDEVDARQARQQGRIQQGVRSGEINGWELRKLQAEQARIAELERAAKRDGRVDPYEAARLRQAQNEASRHIRQESTDRNGRGFGGGFGRGYSEGGYRPWYRRWW